MNKNTEDFNIKYKEALLGIFKRTIDFLETNQIRWFVYAGTCIGTVRHHGIIPWDDDIDILVPRDDYERLFSLRENLKPYSLEMESIEDGSSYYNGFIKIFDSNTTLWERKEYENITGFYIDVFPLERSDIGVEEFVKARTAYRKKMFRYLDSICKTSFTDFCKLLKDRHLKTFMKRLIILPSRLNKEKNYEEYVKATRLIPYDPNGKYMMCLMGSYKEREHWLAEWFEKAIDMPFADFTVKVPVGYDEQLRKMYGDYMKYPPKEKQVSHHYHYYCNFKERLSINEVKKRIMDGETCVL